MGHAFIEGAQVLGRNAGLGELARGGALIDKAADQEDNRLFQLAFGFIPTINIGSAVGIEQPFVRFLVDAVLDPLNYATFGETAAARLAQAGRYLTAERRILAAKKLVNASHYFAKEPQAANRFIELVRAGDAKGLRQHFLPVFAEDTVETRRFFSGSQGRAIRRAVVGGETAELAVGAAAQAAAGQRRLLGFRLPFTDKEVTVLGGRGLFSFGEALEGRMGRWLGNIGAKKVEAMRKGLLAASKESRLLEDVNELSRSLDELSPHVADPAPIKAAQEAMEGYRTRLRKAFAKADLADARVRVELEDTELALARLQEESVNLATAAAAGKGTEVAGRIAPFLVKLGNLVDIAPDAVTPELLDLIGQSAYRISSAMPVRPIGEVSQAIRAKVDFARQMLTKGSVDVARRVIGAEGIRMTLADVRTALKEELAAATEITPKAKAELENGIKWLDREIEMMPGLLNTGLAPDAALYEARAEMARVAAEAASAVPQAVRAIAETPKFTNARAYEAGLNDLANRFVSMAKNLMETDPLAARRFIDSLESAFPVLGKKGLSEELFRFRDQTAEQVIDSIVAAMNPTYSSEFGGPMEGVAGSFGVDFSPFDIADQMAATVDGVMTRAGIFQKMFQPVYQALRGNVPKKTAARATKAAHGFTSKAGDFVAGATDDLFRVSRDIGVEKSAGIQVGDEIAGFTMRQPTLYREGTEAVAKLPGSGFALSVGFSEDQAAGLIHGVMPKGATAPHVLHFEKAEDAGTLLNDLRRLAYAARGVADKDPVAFLNAALAEDNLPRDLQRLVGGLDPKYVYESLAEYTLKRAKALKQYDVEAVRDLIRDRDFFRNLDPSELAVYEVHGGGEGLAAPFAGVETFQGGLRKVYSDLSLEFGYPVQHTPPRSTLIAPTTVGGEGFEETVKTLMGAQTTQATTFALDVNRTLGLPAAQLEVRVDKAGAVWASQTFQTSDFASVLQSAAAQGLHAGSEFVDVFRESPYGKMSMFRLSGADARAIMGSLEQAGLDGVASGTDVLVSSAARDVAQEAAVRVGASLEEINGELVRVHASEYQRFIESVPHVPGATTGNLRRIVAGAGGALHGDPAFLGGTDRKVGDAVAGLGRAGRGLPDSPVRAAIAGSVEPAVGTQYGFVWDARKGPLSGAHPIAVAEAGGEYDLLARLQSGDPAGQWVTGRIRTIDGDVLARGADETPYLHTDRARLYKGLDVHSGEGWVENTLYHGIDDPAVAERFNGLVAEKFGTTIQAGFEETKASRLRLVEGQVGPARRLTTTAYIGEAAARQAAEQLTRWAYIAKGRIHAEPAWDMALRDFQGTWEHPDVMEALKVVFPGQAPELLKAGVLQRNLSGHKLYDAIRRFYAAMNKVGRTDIPIPPLHSTVIGLNPKRVGLVRIAASKAAKPAAVRGGQALEFDRRLVQVLTDSSDFVTDMIDGMPRSVAWIASFDDPKLVQYFTPIEKAARSMHKQLFQSLNEIGHGRWYEEFVKDYFPRVVRRNPGISPELFQHEMDAFLAKTQTTINDAISARVTTRHAKPRILKHFKDLWELQARGILTVETDPQRVVSHYIEAWAGVAANQRMVDQLLKARSIEGLPALVEKGRLAQVVGSTTNRVRQSMERYIGMPDKVFPVLSGYKVHPEFAWITKSFGPQSMRAAIRETNPAFLRALQSMNLNIKGAMLAFSLFHHVALMQSIVASVGVKDAWSFLRRQFARRASLAKMAASGGGDIRPAEFMAIWGEAGGLVEFAVRNGLQLDTFERLASEGFNQLFESVVKAGEKAVRNSPKATTRVSVDGPGGRSVGYLVAQAGRKTLHVNEMIHKQTWEIMHNSGKLYVYANHMKRLLKEFPHLPMETLARQAAETANAQMGGLNWRRIFGNARFRAGMQTFLLAPDWTMSNLAVARDFLVSAFPSMVPKAADGRFLLPFRDLVSPTVASRLARKYWFNYMVAFTATSSLISTALSGRPAWMRGDIKDLAWHDIVTGEYDNRNGEPIIFHTGKQFGEPFELLRDPFTFTLRKTSPMLQVVSGVVLQRDRFGTPITLPEDSAGVKALKNLGFAVSRLIPIPGLEASRTWKRVRTGEGAWYDWLNPITSAMDFSFRRRRFKEPQVPEEQGMPEVHATPAWQMPGYFPTSTIDRSLLLEPQTMIPSNVRME